MVHTPNLDAIVYKLEKQISTLIVNMSNEKKYMKNDIEAGKENTAKVQRHADNNRESIEAVKETQIQTEQAITDMDLHNIKNEQFITDMDLRLIALEV